MLGDVEDIDNQLNINMFQFGYVTQQTVFSGGFDAIVGLAYPTMAEDSVEPFFDAMMREKILQNNVFAFYMSMNPIKDDSELTFGFYNEERYVPDTLKWHPVIDKLFWSL
jgi:hypothetical protein